MKTEDEIRMAIGFNELGMSIPGTRDQHMACSIFIHALQWVLGQKKLTAMDECIEIEKEKVSKLSREAANQ